MLSTDQLLNEGQYSPVGAPPPNTATDQPTDDPGMPDQPTLAQFVGSNSVRPKLSDVYAWTDQLLDAVHTLHTGAEPVIHGGISPSAIELRPDSTVHLRPSGSGPQTDEQVNYKPLEQLWDSLDHFSQRAILNRYDDEGQRWLSQPLSPASDIYSVGALIYSLTTGVVPPDSLDRSIAAMEDKPDPLVPPAQLAPSVPPEVSEVIMKAMSLRREDRYYSAVILRQVFRTAAVRVRERMTAEHEVPPELTTPEPVLNSETSNLGSSPAQQTDPNKAEAATPVGPAVVEARVPPPTTQERAKAPDVSLTSDDPEDDLLEVPVAYVTPRPSREMPVYAPAAVESKSEVEHLETYNPIAETEEPSGRSRTPMFAIAAAVLLLVIGGGVYMFVFTAAPVPAPEPVRIAEVPTPSPAELNADPAAVQAPPAAEPLQVTAEGPEQTAETARVKQNKPVASAQPDATKKAAVPAPAKTPPPKKQLTVDDLINDH